VSAWADAALLKLSSRRPNRRRAGAGSQAASAEIENAWNDPQRKSQILEAVVLARDNSRAQQVLAALEDSDPAVLAAAQRAATALNLDRTKRPGAKLNNLEVEQIIAAVLDGRGDPARGQQLFTQVGCVSCHTVNGDEPLKGPFLGNIASTYKRRELAESILMPNKSIAQGFAAWQFALKNGEDIEGFVVQEAAEAVTIRNIAAQELRLAQSEIAGRTKL
jgi:putative heme-binding domain-containing protein